MSSFLQTVLKLPCIRVIESKVKFVQAKEVCRGCLHEHHHVSVPVLKEGNAVRFLAGIRGRADLLHLLQDIDIVLQLIDLRAADLLIEIIADIWVIADLIELSRTGSHVMSETIHSPLGDRRILLKCGCHMILDIRSIVRENIILIPVEKHAVLVCARILIAVSAKKHDISEISGLHTGVEHTVAIADDVHLDIEFFLQNISKPPDLFPLIVREL